jgi:predicted dehydrogenase
MDALRAGLIGCGTIGRNHASTLDQLGEEIAAVADIDPDARESVAADFGASDAYEDYERMVAESDLDLVVVAVPNALHADCAVAALEADLDVFVEKPLAATLAGARRIEAAAADSDGRCMVGYVKAFDPVFEDVRARALDGEFGRIYDVDVEYVRRRGIPKLGGWFTRKAISGGGALVDAGIHALHLALTVLEFPDVETVSAVTGANFGTRDDYTHLSMWGGDPEPDPEFSTEDYARALVRTADGTALHLHCTWAGNTDPRKNVRVQGTEAGLTVTETDDSDPVLYGTDRGVLTDTALQHPEEGPFERQWSYFADVVRDERDHTRNTVAEGVAVQRLVEAMYESADEGIEVQLG